MMKSCAKKIIGEDGMEYTLVYSVINGVFKEDGLTICTYGLKIEKYADNKLVDCEEISNITSKTIEIDRLFMVLSEHTVTPMCLKEVLEDYLSGTFCEV